MAGSHLISPVMGYRAAGGNR